MNSSHPRNAGRYGRHRSRPCAPGLRDPAARRFPLLRWIMAAWAREIRRLSSCESSRAVSRWRKVAMPLVEHGAAADVKPGESCAWRSRSDLVFVRTRRPAEEGGQRHVADEDPVFG